jgi:6-phosphogluconolactonase
MDEIEWWEFDTLAELAEQVSGDIGFVIESAVAAHGGARIALPGDSIVDPIAKAMLKAKGIAWPKVTILPTDERLVPATDPLSNHGALQKLFGGKGAHVLPLVEGELAGDYQSIGRAADARLAQVEWPLDLVCLAVGPDGHTASIFPGPDYDNAVAGPKGRRLVGVRPDPMPAQAPVDRVTLTAAALSSARAVMIVVDGAQKRELLERAIKEGPLSSVPIGRLIAGIETPIDIFWSAE